MPKKLLISIEATKHFCNACKYVDSDFSVKNVRTLHWEHYYCGLFLDKHAESTPLEIDLNTNDLIRLPECLAAEKKRKKK